MPNYARLLHGARDALERVQQEMAALRPLFPDAPPAVEVYHGSPHNFDKFDFESNLRKGEGAMAFGPGGYLTGNRPLAEHYARSLSGGRPGYTIPAKINVGPLSQTHAAMQQAMKQDPDAVLAWLQASHFRAAESRGMGPAMINGDAYRDFIKGSGITGKSPITKGRIDEVLNAGSDLVGGPQPLPDRTMASQRIGWNGKPVAVWNGPIATNLRGIAAAQSGVPGPKLMMGMGSEHSVDLKNFRQKLKDWDGKSQVITPAREVPEVPGGSKNIYEGRLNVDPNELWFMDYPFSKQHPKIKGALQSLADEVGYKIEPDKSAFSLKDKLPNDLKGMQMMKEAGIPASAFLRAGRRGDLPEQFNPDDFNFVLHNQDILELLARKDRAEGGRV